MSSHGRYIRASPLNKYPQTLPYYKISSIPPSAPSTLVVDRALVLEPFCYVIGCATCLYV